MDQDDTDYSKFTQLIGLDELCEDRAAPSALSNSTLLGCSSESERWGRQSDSVRTHLDVPVENGLGESLQGRTFGRSQAGLGVEQGDPRGVSGQGGGVGVTQHFEVVVDGVTDHHFSREQLQDLPEQKTTVYLHLL